MDSLDNALEKIPLDEKVKLAQNIKQLNDQQLFQVIKIVDQWSPQAIGDIQQDNFKIKIDEVSQLTIYKIYDYIDKVNDQEEQGDMDKQEEDYKPAEEVQQED